jgi:integrase
MRVYSNPRYSDRAFLAKLGISTKRVGHLIAYWTLHEGQEPGPLRDMADLLGWYDAVRGSQMETRARVLRQLHEAMSDELATPLDEIDGNFCERLQSKLDAWHDKRPAEAEQAFYTVRAFLAWSYWAGLLRDDLSHALWGGRVLWGAPRRDRILDFSELADIWQGCDQLPFPFGSAIRFLIATAASANEVMAAGIGDVALNSQRQCYWKVPKASRFTGRRRQVGLNFLAGEAFDEAFNHERRGDTLVFSSTDRPQLENLRHAKNRLIGIIDQQRADRDLPAMERWNFPDLRATFLHWSAEVSDVAFGHACLNTLARPRLNQMLLGYDANCLQKACDELLFKWGEELEEALQTAGYDIF